MPGTFCVRLFLYTLFLIKWNIVKKGDGIVEAKKLANLAVEITLCMTICSAGYLAYSQNVGDVKQRVVSAQQIKEKENIVKNADQANLYQVKRKVLAQTESKLNIQRQGVIAIPDLSIYLPIYNKPYNTTALKKGAQQLNAVNSNNVEINNSMGSGNYILVAHNYSDGKSMFSPLQQHINKDAPYLVNNKANDVNWLDGIQIYTANDKGIYKYQIENQRAIPERQVSIRKDTSKPTLTIITCLFPSDQYRIETQATLVKSWEWDSAPNNVLEYFNQKYNLKK